MPIYSWVDTNITKVFIGACWASTRAWIIDAFSNLQWDHLTILLCVTYIDVRDVCVLVDVHVGHLVTGVWPQGAVTWLARAWACAEARGQEAVVLVRGARETGAAGPPSHQPPWGHRVRPPGPETSRGRGRRGGEAGAAVKIRSHSRLQWVMEWVRGTRGWNKTGPMSALIWAFRVMLMAFLYPQRLQIA